ncbi:MAG: DUF2070 family protein [Saccharolobus sp.]
MDTESLTRKYYRYIKTLPDIKTFSLISLIELILISIRSFQLGFDYLYSFAIYALLVILFFKGKIKISLFMIDLTGIPYLILTLLLIPPIFALGFFLPLMAYLLIGSYRELFSILLSSLSSFVPVIFYPKYIILFSIYIIIIGLIFYIYIYTVNRKGSKILGFKSTQVAIPFITALTDKNKMPLESFLNLISVKTNLHVAVFKLDNLMLMLPQVHFGIFGNVGSSRFVYDVENKLSKNIIVFHGPGSHELDLPSSAEVNKVIEEIIEGIRRNSWIRASFYGISNEVLKNFEITSLEFDKFKISFLERPELGIDDLPSNLWNYMITFNNYIIDCHNSFMIEEYSKEEIYALKHFISSQRGIKQTRKLMLGYAEGELEKKCEGLCDNRIRVLTFSDGIKKISLIYIYANNSSKELKNALNRSLKEIVNKVVLVTPDDHSCTGISLGITYSPAMICDEIVNKAIELVKSSLTNMKEVKDIEYTTIKLKGIKIIGKIISVMLKALEDVGSYTSKTFWIPLVTPYILLVFILLFQSLIKV